METETIVQEQQTQSTQQSQVLNTETTEQTVQAVTELLADLKSQIKFIEQAIKLMKVQYKQETKLQKRKRVRSPSEKKSEFKPSLLSPQLCTFLSLEKGTTMPRDKVAKLIYTYIQKNNLYFEDKPKKIMKPDAKLQKLFGKFEHDIMSTDPSLGKGLSIYNIQKYLKEHLHPVV
jgi:chromatin remodeling complex protein RSC6